MLSVEEYNAMRESGRITFDHNQPKVRTFGGWYRHIIIYLDGQEVGRIQHRRRNKRDDYSTSSGNAAVMGHDARWAVSWHMAQKTV